MSLFIKALQNPVGLVIFSSFLTLFGTYPAFVFVNKGIVVPDSLTFLMLADFSALVIMFLVPALLIKLLIGKRLEDFGLRRPESLARAVKLSLLVILILLPFLYFLANRVDFQQYYYIPQGFGIFFILATLGSGVYYFAEEFIFRGLLFFGLWEKLKFNSFWIINLIFAILHSGKPTKEVLFAFFSGLLLTFLSYKTKSFIPAVVVHFAMALILNIFVIISQ